MYLYTCHFFLYNALLPYIVVSMNYLIWFGVPLWVKRIPALPIKVPSPLTYLSHFSHVAPSLSSGLTSKVLLCTQIYT